MGSRYGKLRALLLSPIAYRWPQYVKLEFLTITSEAEGGNLDQLLKSYLTTRGVYCQAQIKQQFDYMDSAASITAVTEGDC